MSAKVRKCGRTLALLATVGAFACVPYGASAQQASPPAATRPALGTIDEPIELDLAIPRLPPSFENTRPREPDALYQVLFEGYTGVTYQSNVFRAPSDEDADFLWVASPRARLLYDGPEVDAEAAIETEIGRYFDLSENNYFDFGASGSVVWDKHDDDYWRVRANARRGHQGIGADVDDPERQADEVTRFVEVSFGFDGHRRLGDVGVAPAIRSRLRDYENADRADGTRVDNQEKDRVEIDGAVRFTFPASEMWQAVFEPGGNLRFYREEADGAGKFDRDSYGLEPRAGIRYLDQSVPVDAVLTMGVAHQSYQDDRFDSITAFSLLGTVDWEFQTGTRIDLDIERGIGETTLDGAAGAIRTRGRLRLLHNLDDAVSVGVLGEVERREFEVNPAIRSDRTDDVYRLGAEANYLFGDIGFAGVLVEYVNRDSDDADVSFEGVEISARVGARF